MIPIRGRSTAAYDCRLKQPLPVQLVQYLPKVFDTLNRIRHQPHLQVRNTLLCEFPNTVGNLLRRTG